jgi:hypothetical protein
MSESFLGLAHEASERRGELTVHDFGRALPVGSLKNARVKFAQRRQRETIDAIIAELDDGTMYVGDWRKGEIQITGIARIVANRFWCEVEYTVLFPPITGDIPGEGTYRVIRWNSGRMSGVAALCLTENNEIVVLRSFRHAARRWCLEACRGAIKPGESIETCGLREAEEECGVQPTQSSQVIDLGIFDADTGALMADTHIVLVTNCKVDEAKVSRDLSESSMKPQVMSLAQVKEGIASNTIRDSFLMGGLMMAWSKGLVQL